MCGLCGNFDQRSNNDFTTRDHMVVQSELDFGNSWKEAPTCPDVTTTPEPCTKNPHRRAWAEKQCSIIKSSVFAVCHSKVGGAGAGPAREGRGHRVPQQGGRARGAGPAREGRGRVPQLGGRGVAGPAREGCGHGRGRAVCTPRRPTCWVVTRNLTSSFRSALCALDVLPDYLGPLARLAAACTSQGGGRARKDRQPRVGAVVGARGQLSDR